MRFKTRLIIANILFAAGLFSSVTIMFVYSSTQSEYEELVLRTHRLKTMMHATNSRLKTTLFGDNLATAYAQFEEQYTDFRSEVQSLVDDPHYQEVTAATEYGASDTTSLMNVMAMNHDKVQNIESLVRSLTADNTGYLPGPMKAKTELHLFPEQKQKIEKASDSIERSVRYFGSAMSTTLDQIISTIDQAAAAHLERLRLLSLGLVGGVLLFVIIFSYLIIRLLRAKLASLRESLRILSSGDFSHRLEVAGRDELSELGRAVNDFIEEFCTIIRDAKDLSRQSNALKNTMREATDHSLNANKKMKENVETITGKIDELVRNIETSQEATGSITQRISDLNSRIENQSSSVTQSSSSVEEMSASIENVSTISEKRRETAEGLSRIAADTSEKMNETNRLIEENAGDVDEILEVINIINNVASKTNLLSMNAAIEAAHAGDTGRGFAVVAEEIRSLAETTNSNAKKIRTTIKTIADRISRITEMSRETQQAFQQITEETKSSSDSMQEISSSMQELTQGSREIMEAMNSLSGITQEIQEGAEEMLGQTRRVDGSIDEIKSIGDGVNSGIRQIEASTEEVDASIQSINETNEESSKSIEHLQETVAKFKTECSMEEETDFDSASIQ